jgi:prepilin-type N-terminal cleavage/methylation domain-containing protein
MTACRVDTRCRAGFSLVELVMALVVLSFGVLGLATTTLFVTRQLTLAEVTTARAIAIQSVMERIRSTPFDSIGPGGETIGSVAVSWSVTASSTQTKSVRIVSVGPGQVPISASQSISMLSSGVADTFTYKVLRP